jgi:asparagine synthetase B (glutamine-hydrolysing)
MCGIVALYSRRDPISSVALERATESLHHRGPDGQRYWIAPDRRIGLGHRRLSIIDLIGGAQPIASEDERLRIVANGEFYGYESIQRELEQRGHRLRTRSDSEIALHLYEDLGVHCRRDLPMEACFAAFQGLTDREAHFDACRCQVGPRQRTVADQREESRLCPWFRFIPWREAVPNRFRH